MPTPSAPSRSPATSSIPLSPSGCMTTSMRPADRAIPKTPISRSVAARPSLTRCCAGAACSTPPRPLEMTHGINRLLGLLAVIAVLLGGVASACAHPHVWVTASSELVYAPDGSITGVRHAWTFDDMFTTYALQGIETKTKGVYTREQLAPLAKDNVENLKEYGFFTFAKADGKKEKF